MVSPKKTSTIEQPQLRDGGIPTDLPSEKRLAVQCCDMYVNAAPQQGCDGICQQNLRKGADLFCSLFSVGCAKDILQKKSFILLYAFSFSSQATAEDHTSRV